MVNDQPPGQPKPPDMGEYYKQTSSADPLAGKSTEPTSQFDFMLKEPPKPKQGLSLPSGIAGKILVLGVALVVAVLLFVLFFGNKNTGSKQVIDLMAQSQEILRINQLENLQFQNSDTKNLSATTSVTLESQQADLAAYLKKVKVKVSSKELVLRFNKNTDTQLQTAAQNNNLDTAYLLYLKNALTSYQSSMKTVYDSTKSKTLRAALQSAFTSDATILKSSEFTQS
ncbi:MAG TPA: hypothetical protein VFB03_00720 [Candidatus Saccharimonadales bacterium]|nr:hypothetical protein [Candidatus Saccharimonadales bacterium]